MYKQDRKSTSKDQDTREMDNLSIEYHAIGLVHSPFKSMEGTPIQPSRAKQAKGTVELFSEYAAGLSDLDGFSHIILLCHLHKSRSYRLKVTPFLDVKPRGLFATRAPNRPNPIGLSVVKLLGIDGNILSIEGVDMLDQTPVLDIKPYVGEFDHQDNLRMGWLENARKDIDAADSRFK
jgi:tRNA-Thr(GGU) m(6)t(6)A37 methyltransferase TsaA